MENIMQGNNIDPRFKSILDKLSSNVGWGKSNQAMVEQKKKIIITQTDYNKLTKYELNMLRTIGNIWGKYYLIVKDYSRIRMPRYRTKRW